MFDPVTYFETLTKTLKLTKDTYHFTQVSGLESLEGIISNRKDHDHFIAVDDSENGALLKISGGYFNRRPITVFICASADYGNPVQRQSLLTEFRKIHKSFISKLIKDKAIQGLLPFDFTRIPYYEIPGFFADGCVGLYFMFYTDEPTKLIFDATDWTE